MSGTRSGDERLANLDGGVEAPLSYGRGGVAPGKRSLTANLFSSRPRLAAPSLLDGGASAGARGPGQTAGPLLVDDGGPVGPSQMTKGQFLAEVATILPGEDVSQWQAKSCAAIETELKKSVPSTAGARSAREYISAIRAQATQPADAAPAAGGLAALLASPDEHAAADFVRSGQLGAGQALSGSARAAMESAFLHSFSDVRIHTSESAGQLAAALGARAFTVGNQIAFAPGLYDPGSPLGDALLAHELAHVVQQHGATSLGGGSSSALEADADHAAALAVSALHGGEMSSQTPAKPSLHSGLGLQRCPGGGGGGGASALTFSSSAFTAGAGGAVTATPAATQLEVQSSAYASTGTVQATGGTNADAAGWDVGYLQTVTSLTPIGTYTRPAAGAPTQLAITVPNNTRDGNPAGTAPWYDSANPAGTKPFTTTGSTETVTLWDQPRMVFPWDTPDGVGKLASTSGKAKFAAWVAVRKRAAPNTVQYINWETWEVDFSTTTNYAATGAKTVAGITGATTATGSGAGQGANTPNLTGTVGNNLLALTWT